MSQDKKDKNLNVPPLRFPGFTDEWKETTIGDVAKIEKGNGISKTQLSDEGEECILYGELYTKYKSEIIDEVYSKTGIDSTKLTRSHVNDVIIPCSGESAEDIATARCVKKDGILLGGDLNIIRFDRQDGSFMSYQLNGKRKYDIARVAQGVSVVHLYPDHLKSVKIYLPQLEEQQTIVTLLSLIDERIATQTKIIDNLQSLIKGLNDSFHDNVLGEAISFDEIGNPYSGLSGKSGDDFGQGSPYITYLNVYQNNVVDENRIDLVSIDANEKQNTVSYGDILFTLSSETPEETGIGCVYLGTSGKYFLNSFCFGITITQPDKVYPPYLAYLVSSSKFRKFVFPLAQGSTRFNLQKNDFMKKKFTLLPVERQKEISTVLDTLNNRLSVEYKLTELYRKQKDYLLRNLFI